MSGESAVMILLIYIATIQFFGLIHLINIGKILEQIHSELKDKCAKRKPPVE